MNNSDYEKSHLYKIRHSAEHVYAQAVKELYGDKIQLGVAHISEAGFSNDAKWDVDLVPEDLETIEKKMREIIDADLPIVKKEISLVDARELFKDNPFKLEWVEQWSQEDKQLTVYWTGDNYVDLCKGPHVERTSEIKAFKLLSIAGAYWRGDEKNEMLKRVYGTAFGSQQELDDYLLMLEESKKRDHKMLGQKLGLFMFHETSPGMPYWLPNGLKLYNELVNFWREEHDAHNYKEIASPLLNKSDLYVTSGHWEHYKDDMFIANMGENEVYGIKPMNCPNAMLVFKSMQISYRDLPLRLSDTDRLHRYERSGTLNGLLRARSFQQDDSHNYISEDMIESEYAHVFEVCEKFYSIFGLSYSFRMGTRPEGFIGDIETWEKAEASVKKVLELSGKNYFIKEGDGAFYGPKVDILMNDALGREWQMGTIQLDFQQPRRFELEYTDKDGQKKIPVVIHRVIYGSLERFIGLIIEHFAGAFPLWISPVHATILPISGEKHGEYAEKISKELKEADLRIEIDSAAETLGNRIRKAQEMKTPYVIVIGDKEMENKSVNVRLRGGESLGEMSLEDFTKRMKVKIQSKALDL